MQHCKKHGIDKVTHPLALLRHRHDLAFALAEASCLERLASLAYLGAHVREHVLDLPPLLAELALLVRRQQRVGHEAEVSLPHHSGRHLHGGRLRVVHARVEPELGVLLALCHDAPDDVELRGW